MDEAKVIYNGSPRGRSKLDFQTELVGWGRVTGKLTPIDLMNEESVVLGVGHWETTTIRVSE